MGKDSSPIFFYTDFRWSCRILLLVAVWLQGHATSTRRMIRATTHSLQKCVYRGGYKVQQGSSFRSHLEILFSSNHNIHKSLRGLCFWASDPLIDSLLKFFQLKDLKPKNKGHANFYECCDLMEKVYLEFLLTKKRLTYWFLFSKELYSK